MFSKGVTQKIEELSLRAMPPKPDPSINFQAMRLQQENKLPKFWTDYDFPTDFSVQDLDFADPAVVERVVEVALLADQRYMQTDENGKEWQTGLGPNKSIGYHDKVQLGGNKVDIELAVGRNTQGPNPIENTVSYDQMYLDFSLRLPEGENARKLLVSQQENIVAALQEEGITISTETRIPPQVRDRGDFIQFFEFTVGADDAAPENNPKVRLRLETNNQFKNHSIEIGVVKEIKRLTPEQTKILTEKTLLAITKICKTHQTAA